MQRLLTTEADVEDAWHASEPAGSSSRVQGSGLRVEGRAELPLPGAAASFSCLQQA